MIDKKEEKTYQPFQILVSIQRSISDLVSTLDELEAKYFDTYLEEWNK
ncbi:1583_t:CDS:1, partial [Acaulospora colombiana]